jgi:ABC-type Na+ efflux pump permease subunit
MTLIAGLYFIVFSFVMNTENFASALIYKVIPFFLGIGCVFVGLTLLNIIKVVL